MVTFELSGPRHQDLGAVGPQVLGEAEGEAEQLHRVEIFHAHRELRTRTIDGAARGPEEGMSDSSINGHTSVQHARMILQGVHATRRAVPIQVGASSGDGSRKRRS